VLLFRWGFGVGETPEKEERENSTWFLEVCGETIVVMICGKLTFQVLCYELCM